MRVGLIDVDGHSGFPNLALMKISRWHKEHGDVVEWYDAMFGGHYDRVCVSKVFSFTEDYEYYIDADEVLRGGTGYDTEAVLPEEIDRLQPDYSIYPQIDSRTAYGFLTRGCPNRCAWCVVPKKEGKIHPYMDVEEIAIDGRDRLILMDNNVVACDYGLSQIEKIVRMGLRVDFNQAIDARLITDDIASLLSKVKWLGYIRLGCDTDKQVEHCERVIRKMIGFGYKGSFMLYTMLHGSIEECYDRIARWRLEYGSRSPASRSRCSTSRRRCRTYRSGRRIWQDGLTNTLHTLYATSRTTSLARGSSAANTSRKEVLTMSETSYKDNEREVEERMREMDRHSDGDYKMPEE